MRTYQDLQAVVSESDRIDFVRQVINEHKASWLYRTAKTADAYYNQRNSTIVNYQKMLYTISGKAVPDNWSANYKLASGYFYRFVTQQTQFLLGNGCAWGNPDTADRLGDDFDSRLQEAGKIALVCAVAFGYYNLDHLEVFSPLDFAPLHDEENGALRSGVRFWQIADSKPLRATLYEEDGYTDYIWRHGEEGAVLHEKRPYMVKTLWTEAEGTLIYDGENYPSFPIVPLWGNTRHQSELVGLREQIDAYDLIKSGYANDLDDVSQIYWTITNAGGMDDIDLAEFVQRMKTVKAAAVDDNSQAQAHTISVPYEAREKILDRIRRDLYRDYMALDTDEIAAGAVTATQIKAAYEPINSKADSFEYCVLDFLQGILRLAGIEDSPTFTRSIMVNTEEEVQTILQGAEFLPAEYVTRKVLTLLGDGDKADEILSQMAADEIDRARARTVIEDGEQTA